MSDAFRPRTVLGVLVFGAIAFLAMLWFIAQGDTGPARGDGAGHAASRGLPGYAALAALLEAQGHDVRLSRSPSRLEDEALLILTPPMFADAAEVAEIVEARRYAGPTLLILPKWMAAPLPPGTGRGRADWVRLETAATPPWTRVLGDALAMEVAVDELPGGPAPDWQGLAASGRLPERFRVQGLEQGPWASLVRDARGRDLVAYADDRGCYPVLDRAAGYASPDEDDCDARKWAVVVAFEPDLFNNLGLADRSRGLLAAEVVDLAREGQDIPIVFDLTLAGLGGQRNLLTLAFEPPFLAATVCLIAALLVVGWRAFGRFGPPLAEPRTIALGKTQLAANAAGFVRRSGRLHLLGRPYAELVARRLAAALGLRRADPAAIDAALARRLPERPDFSSLAARLEAARGPAPTLRAARALYLLERAAHR